VEEGDGLSSELKRRKEKNEKKGVSKPRKDVKAHVCLQSTSVHRMLQCQQALDVNTVMR
jgi:hypothetical protein